ncbi:hypothetical protein TrLO_g6601 [Triparma laevis f. longispina]|uniref:Uncharacterized protein n=1 Tax=Triparma laevis f. longispina TaxID=1714387 RepID=A0A9W7FMN4_9STRA|nr:hypothetical protein TrLO_g6601 [Triparma laevis f. longispina]
MFRKFWSSFVLLVFAEKVRSRIAQLPDDELSLFMTDLVLKNGIILSLPQLMFIIFGSVQCQFNNPGRWQECSRTLYLQTGLGFMVVVYIAFKILMGPAHKRILNRHILSTRKFVEANLNLNEKFQCTGIFAALGFGLCSFIPMSAQEAK